MQPCVPHRLPGTCAELQAVAAPKLLGADCLPIRGAKLLSEAAHRPSTAPCPSSSSSSSPSSAAAAAPAGCCSAGMGGTTRMPMRIARRSWSRKGQSGERSSDSGTACLLPQLVVAASKVSSRQSIEKWSPFCRVEHGHCTLLSLRHKAP